MKKTEAKDNSNDFEQKNRTAGFQLLREVQKTITDKNLIKQKNLIDQIKYAISKNPD